MDGNRVLSFSSDQKSLAEREVALCNNGFFVVSVASEAQARFEIVMGLCGAFLICHRIDPLVAQELATLFKQNCPEGLIFFIMDRTPRRAPRGVDYIIAEATGTEAIVRFFNPDDSVVGYF
jgi:hypothetical protein